MKELNTFLFAVSLLACTTNSKNEPINTTTEYMEQQDYTISITVNKDAETSFSNIQRFNAWWSEEIEGITDQVGETFFYHYKDVHLCKVKLIEQVANKRLVYLVTENEFSFVEDKTEWVNTKLIFDLTQTGNQTKIVFTHQGLTPAHECYEVCNEAWAGYIRGSLKALIETGIGKPNAREGGLNAELVKKWGLPEK